MVACGAAREGLSPRLLPSALKVSWRSFAKHDEGPGEGEADGDEEVVVWSGLGEDRSRGGGGSEDLGQAPVAQVRAAVAVVHLAFTLAPDARSVPAAPCQNHFCEQFGNGLSLILPICAAR
jgi:hypothetical protein